LGSTRPRRRILFVALAAVVASGVAAVMWPTRPPAAPSGGHPRIEAQLATVLPEVHFRDTPLRDAVADLRAQSGTNLVVEWPVLESLGISPDMPINLRLRDVTLDKALSVLADYVTSGSDTSLEYTASGDAIVITTSEGLAGHVYGRVYDLRDLHDDLIEVGPGVGMFGDPPGQQTQGIFSSGPNTPPQPPVTSELDDELRLILVESVAPEFWYDAGGTGRVDALSGHFLVVAPWCHHRRIDDLLRRIRAPVHPSAEDPAASGGSFEPGQPSHHP
jgi:hypothetical protein